jgi:hypothetical protein
MCIKKEYIEIAEDVISKNSDKKIPLSNKELLAETIQIYNETIEVKEFSPIEKQAIRWLLSDIYQTMTVKEAWIEIRKLCSQAVINDIKRKVGAK